MAQLPAERNEPERTEPERPDSGRPGPGRMSAPALSEGHLTLSRLLLVRAVRPATLVAAGAGADPVISWCLPLDEALATDGRLDEVAVYARASELGTDPVTLLSALAARGTVAVIVASDAGADAAAEVDAVRTGWLSQAAIPVAVLPASVGYLRVSRLIGELSLARETHELRYGLTVHRALAELLHTGAGLTALCYQLSRLSGCPAAILDRQRRLLAFEESQGRGLSPLAVGQAMREAAVELFPEVSPAQAGPMIGVVDFGGLRATCVVEPIVLAGRHDGWVVVIESGDPPHPHDLAEHRVVVEQAAMIVGTEMLRMRSVEQAEERARGDFVQALLHGRFTTAHDLQVRAQYYGFPVSGAYGVVVASGLADLVSSESPAAMFQLARDAARLHATPGRQTLATVVGDVLVVIREVSHPERGGPADADGQALAEYASKLESELARRAGRSVLVAYGRVVGQAAAIPQSYRDARVALGLRQRLRIDRVCGFGDLRIYATLADLAVSPAGKAFASEMLSPLRGSRAEDLERVVIEYIETGGNVNATARNLHIHRNTMLYKLDRASRALRLDLRQAEHQFSVWLAYKMAMLAEATEKADHDVRPH